MDNQLSSSRDILVQALGRQSAFWGLGKTAGEMYAVLYLGAEPLSLEEVAKRIKVTKGNISVAIRQLEQLGMVRRLHKIGDRRVYFEPETDFWKIAHSVLALRHKPEFQESFDLVEESIGLASRAEPTPERDTIMARLKELQDFYRLLDSMVETALSLGPGGMKKMTEAIKLLVPDHKL
ncbi:MAG: MarR family transcriptional regulator [Bacillota bacterium]